MEQLSEYLSFKAHIANHDTQAPRPWTCKFLFNKDSRWEGKLYTNTSKIKR